MREYEFVVDEALRNGLSPELVPINAKFLYQCIGFRCGKGRLEPHILLSNPIPITIDMFYHWPFPQFIVGERYNFLVVRDSLINQWDSVYLVSNDHVTVTHIFDIDELTFGIGTLIEVADFGEYVFMTNGVIMLIWNVVLNSWQAFTASSVIPMMRTVCNLKGQAIGGNIVSSWYDCNETFYVWSKIGSMDFSLDQGNESGYRRCPFGGVIRNVRRLGEAVIGYSSKGVTSLIPVAEPATMGFKELLNIGIINQGAVNGSSLRHIFVDENYAVREVTSEGVKEIGYKSQISQLSGEDIIVSYDPASGDFYIGNSIKTFLLSPYGMTEVLQHPSAVWRNNQSSYMIPDTVDANLPVIKSEAIDMGYAGQKTISTVESDVANVTGPEAGADTTFDNNSWILSTYKPINNQGIATAAVSGNAFRACIRFESINANSRISYLKVRYKMTDLRGIRGVYAPGLRGQSDGQK